MPEQRWVKALEAVCAHNAGRPRGDKEGCNTKGSRPVHWQGRTGSAALWSSATAACDFAT